MSGVHFIKSCAIKASGSLAFLKLGGGFLEEFFADGNQT